MDAQGVPLSVESTRIATVQFGDVCFKEKFIIADVTSPLIALGHVIRCGWSLVQRDGKPCLVKGDKMIQVLYRNNSLCARGRISRVSEVSPEDAVHSIRVVQPGIVLRTLCLVGTESVHINMQFELHSLFMSIQLWCQVMS